MNKLDILFEKANLIKEAYPNIDYRDPEKQYDLNKWVLTMQKIKSMMDSGYTKYSSIDNSTKGWGSKELNDFINWMKYYESGDFVKYKFASLYNSPTNPGYYLHTKNNELKPDFNKVDDNNDEDDEEESESQRLEEIEKTRSKVLSRLKSIDKVIDSEFGKDLLGNGYDEFVELIYGLMKKFRKLKKSAKSNTTYNDLIVKEANAQLRNNQQLKYEFLIRLAQFAAPPAGQNLPPNQPTGSPGLLPSQGPGMNPPPNDPPKIPDLPPLPPPTDSSSEPSPEGQKGKGIKDFVNKMQSNYSDMEKDKNKSEDVLFVSEAQLAPQPNKLINPNEPVSQQHSSKNYDNAIDNLFSSVKVEDVVDKLEQLSNIFKEREIPRQLAIIDMMLNALNLSPMFPGLSESHNKALESNNYILTRIEDVLSKLRGAIKSPPLDLEKDKKPSDPRANQIAESLKEEEELDRKKKEMRKELENQALKETPEIEVSEDVPPAIVEEPKPVPTKPLAPPSRV